MDRRKRTRGMTLLEILVVVAILSLLAAATAVAVVGHKARADRRLTLQMLSTLRAAAVASRATGPSTCPTPVSLRAERFLDPQFPKLDPWGTPFSILCNDDEVQTRSAGPDHTLDTADDLWAPPPEKP